VANEVLHDYFFFIKLNATYSGKILAGSLKRKEPSYELK
jgi:hypothetical protein